jgi:hypothetical protein
MLNLWILQWPLIRCCKVLVRPSTSLIPRAYKEDLEHEIMHMEYAGTRTSHPPMDPLQHRVRPPPSHINLLTSLSLILYLAYFPTHLKYCRTLPLPATDLNDDVLSSRAQQPEQEPTERDPLVVDRAQGSNLVKYETTSEWRIAVIMSLTVLIHLYVPSFIQKPLTNPPLPSAAQRPVDSPYNNPPPHPPHNTDTPSPDSKLRARPRNVVGTAGDMSVCAAVGTYVPDEVGWGVEHRDDGHSGAWLPLSPSLSP